MKNSFMSLPRINRIKLLPTATIDVNIEIRNLRKVKELPVDQGQIQLLETFPYPTAILDSAGEIILTNDEWNTRRGECVFLDSMILKGDFFEYCRELAEKGSDDALKLIIGLRQILDGNTNRFNFTFLCSITAENVWYKLNIRPFNGGRAILFAEEVTQNITATLDLKENRNAIKSSSIILLTV